jgi:hypothetical protein
MLDPNHNYFIFVDDGSREEYGKEIDFRVKLEEELRKNKLLSNYEWEKRSNGKHF